MRSSIPGMLAGWLAASALCASSPAAAYAGDSFFSRGWWERAESCCRSAVHGRCCDDYVAKPLPLVPCRTSRCGCDDYCRQPIPCTTPPTCGACDDYECKPAPRNCWSRTPNLVCVPYRLSCGDEPPRPEVDSATKKLSRAAPAETSTFSTTGAPKIRWVR